MFRSKHNDVFLTVTAACILSVKIYNKPLAIEPSGLPVAGKFPRCLVDYFQFYPLILYRNIIRSAFQETLTFAIDKTQIAQ